MRFDRLRRMKATCHDEQNRRGCVERGVQRGRKAISDTGNIDAGNDEGRLTGDSDVAFEFVFVFVGPVDRRPRLKTGEIDQTADCRPTTED